MDIRTTFIDFEQGADLALADFDLDTDDGLETAVVLSLFTDARAADDDILPLGQADRRGWWADGFGDEAGDRIGSRLWLLHAAKQLPEVLIKVKEYAEEALAWMVEDGVAIKVEVDTWIPREEVLGMVVRIYRPTGAAASYRFESLWKNV